MASFTESPVEDAGRSWLETLGWRVVHGPGIATDTPGAERSDYGEVVLERRLRDALGRLNPDYFVRFCNVVGPPNIRRGLFT